MNELEFKCAYIDYCNDGGHSFDPWDIAVAWNDYQENPDKFNYLLPFYQKEFKEKQ